MSFAKVEKNSESLLKVVDITTMMIHVKITDLSVMLNAFTLDSRSQRFNYFW